MMGAGVCDCEEFGIFWNTDQYGMHTDSETWVWVRLGYVLDRGL